MKRKYEKPNIMIQVIESDDIMDISETGTNVIPNEILINYNDDCIITDGSEILVNKSIWDE